MFTGQLISPYVLDGLNLDLPWGKAADGTDGLHQVFSAGYVALFACSAWMKRRDMWALRLGTRLEQRLM